MKIHSYCHIALVFMLFLCLGTFVTEAADAKKNETKAPQTNFQINISKPEKKVIPAGDHADLTVDDMAWIDHTPAIGDRVGQEGVLKISIVNKGKKLSENCYVKFTCMPLSGVPCPNGVNKVLPCEALYSNQKLLSWPPSVSNVEKWQAGKYRLTVEVDSTKKVVESDEFNNIVNKDFTVFSKVVNTPGSSPNQSIPTTQGVVPFVRPDVVIQNVKMTPFSPYAGEHIKFSITFRNIGNGQSGNMEMYYGFYRIGSDGIRYWTNGNTLFDPRALAPGEILEKSYVLWPYDFGAQHDYEKPRSGDTFEAVFRLQETTTSIQESNTDNNSKTITFKLK
ncbi:MAG: CARDB domain-containing protein [Pseudomonadota bacterium]